MRPQASAPTLGRVPWQPSPVWIQEAAARRLGRRLALCVQHCSPWRRIWNYLRWRRAQTPVMLHLETGAFINLLPAGRLPTGTWLLRRPLTLPESTMPLYLGARLCVTEETKEDPCRYRHTTFVQFLSGKSGICSIGLR